MAFDIKVIEFLCLLKVENSLPMMTGSMPFSQALSLSLYSNSSKPDKIVSTTNFTSGCRPYKKSIFDLFRYTHGTSSNPVVQKSKSPYTSSTLKPPTSIPFQLLDICCLYLFWDSICLILNHHFFISLWLGVTKQQVHVSGTQFLTLQTW